MKTLGLSLLSAALCLSNAAHAQECYFDNIIETTPTENFIDNLDGTVRDVSTGKVWTKCSIGQAYDNGECTGEATNFASWAEALQHVESLNQQEYLGYNDFRLPNTKELGTIVERACYEPAINLTVFPSTPSNTYVTSTPRDNTYFDTPYRYINFETGAEFTPAVSFTSNIRMVRN